MGAIANWGFPSRAQRHNDPPEIRIKSLVRFYLRLDVFAGEIGSVVLTQKLIIRLRDLD